MAYIKIWVPDPPKPRAITFTSNGQTLTANAVPFDTSFYIITEGKYRGNLVHLWDIIKGK